MSPRLGIRLEWKEGEELKLYRPDGRRFLTSLELEERAIAAEEREEQERQRADEECRRAEQERQRAEQVEQREQRLRQRLIDLGLDPDQF